MTHHAALTPEEHSSCRQLAQSLYRSDPESHKRIFEEKLPDDTRGRFTSGYLAGMAFGEWDGYNDEVATDPSLTGKPFGVGFRIILDAKTKALGIATNRIPMHLRELTYTDAFREGYCARYEVGRTERAKARAATVETAPVPTTLWVCLIASVVIFVGAAIALSSALFVGGPK